MINKQSTLGFDKIYVINLKRRPDRKENLIKTLPGLDLTFIEAVDGNELSVEQLIKENKLKAIQRGSRNYVRKDDLNEYIKTN